MGVEVTIGWVNVDAVHEVLEGTDCWRDQARGRVIVADTNAQHCILVQEAPMSVWTPPRAALASGIRMPVFRSTDKYFRGVTEPMLLEDLTSTTGGTIVHFEQGPSAKEHDHFHGMLNRGYDEMAHFYQMEIELQSNLEKERRWTLEILDEHGKKRKDVQVSYPQELPPCPISDSADCASTSVTSEPAGHTASILVEPGLLGMPPNRSRIRRGEAPQVGVACENPLLDRKQPTSLSEYEHIRFKFY